MAGRAPERFATAVQRPEVVSDLRTVADFISIFCRGNHGDRARGPVMTDAAALGVYGRRVPKLCDECEAHLAYAERRRAYCPKDPKPFCAHCDTHCYRPDESAWQRQMMRYAGPRSMLRGYAIEGIKHALEARRYRAAKRAREQAHAPAKRRDDG